jgi:hypothetical protein
MKKIVFGTVFLILIGNLVAAETQFMPTTDQKVVYQEGKEVLMVSEDGLKFQITPEIWKGYHIINLHISNVTAEPITIKSDYFSLESAGRKFNTPTFGRGSRPKLKKESIEDVIEYEVPKPQKFKTASEIKTENFLFNLGPVDI